MVFDCVAAKASRARRETLLNILKSTPAVLVYRFTCTVPSGSREIAADAAQVNHRGRVKEAKFVPCFLLSVSFNGGENQSPPALARRRRLAVESMKNGDGWKTVFAEG